MESSIAEMVLLFCGIILLLEIAIIGILIRISVDINRLKYLFHTHKRECDRRFYALARDFKQHASKSR